MNLPATRVEQGSISFNDEMLAVIKQSVAADASDSEFKWFVASAQSSGLNPLRGEIWFTRSQGKPQIMTGIHGFYRIANRHKQYDGTELEDSATTVTIEEFGQKKQVPEYIEARVYRKDRSRPSVFRAYWIEYAKPLKTKNGYPTNWWQLSRVMLSKCAEAMALRKAFPQELNDYYAEEEMPVENARDYVQVVESQPTIQPVKPKREGPFYYSFSSVADDDERRSIQEHIKKRYGARPDRELGLWVTIEEAEPYSHFEVQAPGGNDEK